MNIELILIITTLTLVVIGFGVFFYLFFRKKEKPDDQSMLMIQNQLTEMSRNVEDKIKESNKAINSFTEKIVKLDETNKQVVGFADQLQNLQDILKNPKQRGILGEYYLEAVLQNVLSPGLYKMQYGFKDGSTVDAVVFLRDKIIPIDSKFSLENYNKLIQSQDKSQKESLEKQLRNDLKKRIDETSKYIKPDEGTMDFAFMFIPSEALYYDLLVNKVGSIDAKDLVQYATGKKKVIIVSPTSFLAYLQTVLQGLKALQIEESAKDIQKWVRDLGRHLQGYEENIQKLGKHLGTSVRSFNSAYKEFGKIDKDINRIVGESMGSDVMELDLPKDDEEDE
ncbi:MAG: DNA recombination protein RmuC [Candidatus Paceibacterota bacterium]